VGRLPCGQGHLPVHVRSWRTCMVHPRQLAVPYSCPTGWRERANRTHNPHISLTPAPPRSAASPLQSSAAPDSAVLPVQGRTCTSQCLLGRGWHALFPHCHVSNRCCGQQLAGPLPSGPATRRRNHSRCHHAGAPRKHGRVMGKAAKGIEPLPSIPRSRLGLQALSCECSTHRQGLVEIHELGPEQSGNKQVAGRAGICSQQVLRARKQQLSDKECHNELHTRCGSLKLRRWVNTSAQEFGAVGGHVVGNRAEELQLVGGGRVHCRPGTCCPCTMAGGSSRTDINPCCCSKHLHKIKQTLKDKEYHGLSVVYIGGLGIRAMVLLLT
jgi:hypothetical protein